MDGKNLEEGIAEFIKQHQCSDLCKAFGFSRPQPLKNRKGSNTDHSHRKTLTEVPEKFCGVVTGNNHVYLSYQPSSCPKSTLIHIMNFSDDNLPNVDDLYHSQYPHASTSTH